ncbi:hypothetical protein J6590_047101 [Homalodisca vitripennis]|nr:hypothetical protein J6590_047101 [Homalodisca vitripennis]
MKTNFAKETGFFLHNPSIVKNNLQTKKFCKFIWLVCETVGYDEIPITQLKDRLGLQKLEKGRVWQDILFLHTIINITTQETRKQPEAWKESIRGSKTSYPLTWTSLLQVKKTFYLAS